MGEPVRCAECGTTASVRAAASSGEPWCPACLASFARDESEDPIATAARVPPPLPSELSGTGERRNVGKFILAESLGVGSTGEVWKAWDTVLGRWVALKLFHEHDPQDHARFEREARTAATLSHPNIATIYETGRDGGRSFIAMQYVEGATLLKQPKGDRRQTVGLLRDAARAVADAHRHGIVHRDLKPDNIVVARRGEDPSHAHVYILDFGLARRIQGGDRVTATGIVVGTPAYLPPEQGRGERVDGRADVYSLGATLYHLLTGRPPFRGSNVFDVLRKVQERDPVAPRRLVLAIERDLETIILKCLEKDPARRYATADALAEDLDRWLDGEPIQARPVSLMHRGRRFIARRKSVLLVGAAGLLLAVGLTAYLTASRVAEARSRDRARSYLESGRRILDQIKVVIRTPYRREDLRHLAERAQREFEKALAEHPNDPDAWMGIGRAWRAYGDVDRATAALTNALAASSQFASARLDLAEFKAGRYQSLRHGESGELLPEDDHSRRLREEIEADLRQVAAQTRDSQERLLSSALLALGDGRNAEALEMLTRYVELVPTELKGHVWRGKANLRCRKRKESVEDLTRAIAADAGRADSYYERGNAWLGMYRLDEAIADYAKAVELSPLESSYHNSLGRAKWHKKAYDEALAHFDRALELDPTYVHARRNRGITLGSQGRADDALRELNDALALNPDSHETHRALGVWMSRRKRFEEAVVHFKQALKLCPSFGRAYADVVEAQRALGIPMDLIAEYTRVIEIDPDYYPAWNNRGKERQAKGLLDEALADFDECTRINPNYAMAYANRGVIYMAKGRLDDAIAECTKALQLDARFDGAYGVRAGAKYKKGLVDEAIADLDRAIELNGKNAGHWVNRGLYKARRDLHRDAIPDYDKTIALDPKHVEAYYNRGMSWQQLDEWQKACDDYTEALRLRPDHWNAMMNRGRMRLTLGDKQSAKEDLDLVLRHVRDAIAFFHRAAVHVEFGNPEAAAADFDEALKVNPSFLIGYWARAWFRYSEGSWAGAKSDFEECCKRGFKEAAADHARLMIWLCACHLGERESATRELNAYAAARNGGDSAEWATAALRFVTGSLSEAELLAAHVRSRMACEVLFHVGMRRLLDGNRVEAQQYFERAAATGKVSAREYRAALAELRRLGAGQ